MANCLFSYPDRTLSATVETAGNTWLTSLPLTNVKNRLKTKVARSAGVTTSDTKFDITLADTYAVRIVAILCHNASKTATVKLSFSNVSKGGSELGSYSGLEFWPSYYPSETPLEWEETDFWGGTISDADASDYKPSPDFWYVLPQVIMCKYIRVEITDTSNTAGYFQLGRCFVGNGFQPNVNMAYDASIVWKQDVYKEKAIGGTEWFEIKSQAREIQGKLSDMSIGEGMVQVFERQRKLGQEGELFFIFDPDDTVLLYKLRSMLCRFSEESPLSFPYFDTSSGDFKLVEVI